MLAIQQMQPRRLPPLRIVFFWLTLALLQFLYFQKLALERLIAKDEGFYLYAARLVLEGERLYSDFFFPQMPLTAWFWAGGFALGSTSWITARTLAALVTTACGLLLFAGARRRCGSPLAFLGLALFMSSNHVFPWYLTVQTYSLSVLFLLAAWCCWPLPAAKPRNASIAAAGLFFALALQSRLFFAGLGPLFLLALSRIPAGWAERRRWLLLFCSAAAIGLLPSFFLLLRDWQSFYFNNLGYHLIRSSDSFWEGLPKKWLILSGLLGLRETAQFSAFQFPLLLYGSLSAALFLLIKRRKIDLAFYLAAGLGLINFLPTPSYIQYFCTLLPFLIIGLLYGLQAAALKLPARWGKSGVFSLALLSPLLLLYLWQVPLDIERFTRSGYGVIGIGNPREAARWNLKRVSEIAARVDQLNDPADPVIAFWPGFLLESKSRVRDGLENHFGYQIAERLSPAQQQRYRLQRWRPALQTAKEQGVALVLLRERSSARGPEVLLRQGFRAQQTLPPVQFFNLIATDAAAAIEPE